jgi:Kef-type K+ transport system membrane component KefB
MTHPDFRAKLEAAGFGIFIPVFFVTTGVRYDLDALTADASTLLHVPIFLAALVVVRGLPALLYRPVIPRERVPVAVLMQATSLPFIWRPPRWAWRCTWSRPPTRRRSSPPACCRW